jgi:hypothetical protein
MNKQNRSAIPDESKTEELLSKLQPVPSETFHQQMAQAAWHINAEKQNRRITRNHLLKIAVACAVLLVGITLLATPQGRAFAQRIFLFFIVTEDTSFPIPTEQVYALLPTETPVPAHILPLEPVEPVPTQTPQAPHKSCTSPEAQPEYFCQIQTVEGQAGFDAKEFPHDPRGLKFLQAAFNPTTKAIDMEFGVITGGGSLYLSQGTGEFPSANKWGEVPLDAIEQVTVNGQYAELALGTFVVYPNTSEAVWQPGGLLRLHWSEGDRWFSLEKMGDPYPIEWINENEIIKLAESLVDERPLDQAPPVDPEYLTSVEAAEELAGFDLPAPTLLPKGYELKRVVWAENTARLIYGPKNSSEYTLLIFMGPIGSFQSGPCLECPPGAVEDVRVGPWPGWYMRGAFNMGAGANVDPTPTPVWEPDALHWGLSWNTDTLWFSMSYFSSNDYGGEMNKETMVKIAESLK